MVGCSVHGCKSRSDNKNPEISFHRFPLDPIVRKKWINATGQINYSPKNSSRICSIHFEDIQIKKINKFTRLVLDAVPAKFVNMLPLTGSPSRPAILMTSKQQLDDERPSVSKRADMEVSPWKRKMTQKFIKMQHRLRVLSKKLRAVRQSRRRLKKKTADLNNVLDELKCKFLVGCEEA